MLHDPKQIEIFRLKTIAKGLEIEIKTGMRHSRNSTFNAAKAITGKKTRAACLDAIKNRIASMAWHNIIGPLLSFHRHHREIIISLLLQQTCCFDKS